MAFVHAPLSDRGRYSTFTKWAPENSVLSTSDKHKLQNLALEQPGTNKQVTRRQVLFEVGNLLNNIL